MQCHQLWQILFVSIAKVLQYILKIGLSICSTKLEIMGTETISS